MGFPPPSILCAAKFHSMWPFQEKKAINAVALKPACY